MRANKPIHAQACQVWGCGRLATIAAISTNIPAGISRIAAINSGVVCGSTPFIATIAVPQRKKGAIGKIDAKLRENEDCFDCMKGEIAALNKLYSFLTGCASQTIDLRSNVR